LGETSENSSQSSYGKCQTKFIAMTRAFTNVPMSPSKEQNHRGERSTPGLSERVEVPSGCAKHKQNSKRANNHDIDYHEIAESVVHNENPLTKSNLYESTATHMTDA